MFPPTKVTEMPTVPLAPNGIVHSNFLEFSTVTLEQVFPPIVTVAPAAKLLLYMVNLVPPAIGPRRGKTLTTRTVGQKRRRLIFLLRLTFVECVGEPYSRSVLKGALMISASLQAGLIFGIPA
jgi:hypothetical protein